MKVLFPLVLIGCAALFPRGAGGEEPRVAATEEISALIEAAEPGSTIAVPAGLYRGHLIVRKSVTLDGDHSALVLAGAAGESRFFLLLSASRVVLEDR